MKRLKELREKRSKMIADAREILDTAANANRQPSAEEQARHAQLMTEQDGLRTQIQAEERQLELDREMAETRSREVPAAGAVAPAQRAASPRGTPEFRAAYSRFLAFGESRLTGDEQRALAVGTDTGGGFLTAPEQFITDLIQAVDDMVFIRKKATKIPVPQAQSLGVPTLDADPADSVWTSEIQTGDEDSSMAIGKRKLSPHAMAKRIKVSKDLLRQALIGAEPLVRARLAYKFGITEEKAFLTGDGVGKPLGVFTVSNDGIPATRDVSAGNLVNSPTFDGLLAAKYALKGPYRSRPTVSWMFHRDAILKIAQLKDLQNQYIWKESVRVGEPDTILGLPVAESELVPNTFTTGLYVGALADWSYYWIADALDLAIQRLDELYAETNQVGFIGRMACDGQPVLAEAFVRVKLA